MSNFPIEQVAFELGVSEPPQHCTICRTQHHPRWHQITWRDDVRRLATRADRLAAFTILRSCRKALENPRPKHV